MKTQNQNSNPKILIEEKLSPEKTDWKETIFILKARKGKQFFSIEKSYFNDGELVKTETEINPAYGVSLDETLKAFYEMKNK